jgi:hypothetical protein
MILEKGCIGPWRQASEATKFLTVAPNIFSVFITGFPPVSAKISISSYAPSRKHQITLSFTRHSITLGPQNGACFISPFWCLVIGSAFLIFGKFVDPCVIVYIKQIGEVWVFMTQDRDEWCKVVASYFRKSKKHLQ